MTQGFQLALRWLVSMADSLPKSLLSEAVLSSSHMSAPSSWWYSRRWLSWFTLSFQNYKVVAKVWDKPTAPLSAFSQRQCGKGQISMDNTCCYLLDSPNHQPVLCPMMLLGAGKKIHPALVMSNRPFKSCPSVHSVTGYFRYRYKSVYIFDRHKQFVCPACMLLLFCFSLFSSRVQYDWRPTGF